MKHGPLTHSPVVRWLAPLVVGVLTLLGWELAVRYWQVEEFILPAPSAIARELIAEGPELLRALGVTLRTMGLSLALATVLGVALAAAFSMSRVLELSLFPYAVILQVTPLVVIAPLLTVWLGDQVWLVLVLCAAIVALFPILANTTVGLQSADPGLRDLLRLYRATPWQRLVHLLLPSALPYFLSGLKIAANLALVGSVVAEFAVGASGTQTGLASTILECMFRLQIPKMFAALVLISTTGITIYFVLHGMSRWLLSPWHASSDRNPR